MSEFNPNDTTKFDASLPGGTKVSFSGKRVSELLAGIALLVLGISNAFTWQMYQEQKAFGVKLEATQARMAALSERLEASNRYLACVTLSRDADKGRVAEDCRTTAGYSK